MYTQKLYPFHRLFDLILALITWIGIILQFYYSGNLANSISFFTIQTNMLIALSLTILLFFPATKVGSFFSKISVQSSLTLYIVIVSLIYNFALRSSWNQDYPQVVYDNILHVVTPVFYVLRWIIYIPKGTLKWSNSLKWLVYPLAYLLYSLVRGAIVQWYPYFFVDMRKISYSELLINTLVVLFAFLIIGAILIYIDLIVGRKIKVRSNS